MKIKSSRTYMQKIVDIINQLSDNHPKIPLGKHIDTALDGEDIWSLTNNKFYSLLKNYQSKLNTVDLSDDNFEVDKIIRDGMDLSFDEDEFY
ncbi:MAG: hypothetical protein CMJ25_10030 [Phycisphaerae bacterium]|jgi:hypothetical protein|nr:hypothetical protein [Phycisphaerae bacterium]|tara:strand:+ start:1479 stop:1754 length:276 start_codon:yes stop_codon:yes gene_type:complete